MLKFSTGAGAGGSNGGRLAPERPQDGGPGRGGKKIGRGHSLAREPSVDPQLVSFKVPPHSVEAEQSLLGALLIDNQAFDRVADLVIADDFYRDDHRRIWRHISRLVENSRPADVV